ncbi:MAG: glycosyltransferase family 39 protein, partial [Psychrobacter sp.]
MILSIGQPIWFDEGYSVYVARQPIGELLALTAVDAHPPLYYVLLKLWAGLFGWGEFALRSLSGVAVALTVGAVFMTVRRLFSVRIALGVLPFLILAPFFLRYGYEVRMYAVAGLIGALATMTLVYALKAKRATLWVIYAALVALGMYTLYMMAALWFAHAIWLLVRSIRRKENFRRWKWFFAYILSVILFLPYITTFIHQLVNSALPGIGQQVTLTRVVDMGTMLSVYTPEWKIGGWVSLVLATLSITVVWLLIRLWRVSNRDDRKRLVFLASLALVPVIFYAVTSLPPRDPIFVNRYLAHTVIWIYLLVGIVIALSWKYQKKMKVPTSLLAGITITVLMISGTGVLKLQQTGNLVFERMQKPRTIELRNDITCDSSTTIVAADPYTYLD